MTKIIGAVVAVIVIAVAIGAWSKFAVVRPKAAATTDAAAAENPSTISPFDAMTKYGKTLPLEDWRPAN